MGQERLDLDGILSDRGIRIIVCCGSGGVGKTTTAAALAVRAAERHGRRTVVLTIDPARRLAQSMGLTELDNTPRPVPDVKPDNGGELHAMMLDMKRTFDEVVLTHTTQEKAEEIFANPFYQAMSSTFAGTQEYMAMEKLSQLAAIPQDRGGWDLIVVDTPPSRSALDFLDAPKRLATFLDSRMLRILLAPARAGGMSMLRVLGSSLNIFGRAMHKILGGQLIGDLSTFVASLDSTFGGFADRAARTYQVLQAKQTAFLVVATPEPDAIREAGYFAGRLSEERMPLAGLVLNRVHGLAVPALSAERALAAAEALEAGSTASAGLTAEVLLLHADLVRQVARESRIADRFRRAHPEVAVTAVPARAEDVHDLDGLREISASLTD
ncbi:MAG: ArsA family ATPase [Micromonosporaceae bacterium]